MDDIPCTYRLSVKAIISDDDGCILLLKELDGSWELPGGGIEHGESATVALAREIQEETGMTVHSISEHPVAFWTIRKDVDGFSLKWFAFVAYEAKISGNFHPDPANEEAQEAKYFSKAEAQKLQLHDNTKPYFS